MAGALLLVLVVLWFLGYIRIQAFPIPDLNLFVINGQNITLWNLLTFLVILWLIGILPTPFREIGVILFALWVLATLGLIAIAGFSNLIVIAIIAGVALSFL